MASEKNRDRTHGDSADEMPELNALRASVERETIAFEREVQIPFLPSDGGRVAFNKFEQHCQHLDQLFGSPVSTLRHYSLMVITDAVERRIAVLYDLPNHKPEYKQLDPTEAALDPLDYYCGRILTRRTVPHFARPPISTPTVVPPTPLLCLLYARTTDGVQDGTVALLADLPASATPLVVCDAIMCNVATSHATQPESALGILNALRPLKRNFEAYHLVCAGEGGSFTPTTQQLAVARLLAMQFQREWGDKDQQFRARQSVLLALSHEYKNALLETDWQNNLLRVHAWNPTSSSDKRLRIQLLAGLSRMVWPQALSVAFREFADAIRGTGRLREQLLEDAQYPRETKAFADTYVASIEYLIAYVCSTLPLSSDSPPKLARLNIKDTDSPEFNNAMLVKSARPIMPIDGAFDRSKLAFPPLKQDEAATFFGATIVVEPIRNALKYLVANQIEEGVLGYGVFPHEDGLRIIVANSKRQNASIMVVPSLDILREIGRTTGLATVGEPFCPPHSDNKVLAVVCDMHPHKLRELGAPL